MHLSGVQIITTGLHFILKALHTYHTHTQGEESPIQTDDKSKTMPDIQLQGISVFHMPFYAFHLHPCGFGILWEHSRHQEEEPGGFWQLPVARMSGSAVPSTTFAPKHEEDPINLRGRKSGSQAYPVVLFLSPPVIPHSTKACQ